MQSAQNHSIQPITIVEQVIDEYKNYLLTEFRARDENLRKALEEALQQPKFLAQEPFFQAHRPFKTGKSWKELELDPKLVKVMEQRSKSPYSYLHQSLAIENLLSPQAQPMVVTTGTGSGKTECFLLPAIQNAIEDASTFKESGLTTLIIYPMNALANDQEVRIRDFLNSSGHTSVSVERYDRTTNATKRAELRKKPPHILLTNYMMLEYLLVRPADREALFKNHRCRYVVLDEVHTYRGSLGSNIALLFRRLRVHLKHATQDWNLENNKSKRFPKFVSVATSATIKSIDEEQSNSEKIKELRDQAVQNFLHQITGYEAKSFLVLSETLQEIAIPKEAKWETNQETPIQSSAMLWKLHELLIKKPRSIQGIVEEIRAEVPQRQNSSEEEVRQEVIATLIAGASLPKENLGSLQLRVHRFIRGGWKFYRCINMDCGKLYPLGQESCQCGMMTAPLFLCRSCGADVLGFVGSDNPEETPLQQRGSYLEKESIEWYLYDQKRLKPEDEDEEDDDSENYLKDLKKKQIQRRSVFLGSFDPKTRNFSQNSSTYSQAVLLAPSLNKCLVCGAFAGSGKILTPVGLGTSAAVKVVAEGLVETLSNQNKDKPGHDKKERLLIFSDSRQDAAHQARFITYSSRYDRMRRHIYHILKEKKKPLTFEETITALFTLGCQRQDNPHISKKSSSDFIPQSIQKKAKAWEEAPLLDDLAVSAGFRASIFNLGLVGVQYDQLKVYVEKQGTDLLQRLKISNQALLFLARCILDEMRVRKAISHEHLRYHPSNPSFPEHFHSADWERRIKTPHGYAYDDEKKEPSLWMEVSTIEDGIRLNNFWRKPKTGGQSPSIERKYKKLMTYWGGDESQEGLLLLLRFLHDGDFILAVDLHGYRKSSKLFQVNLERILLELITSEERYKCNICNVKIPCSYENAPCPACSGRMKKWPEKEIENNRYVQRILKEEILPLNAGEHTAQITGNARIELETNFKAPPEISPMNVLACSPTLEMGIDVGGLDAVIMRNVPPRPDNYAQRGGRAGRSSRTGIVLSYTRNTPHDGYFYDKPEEMISGEVPAPDVGLGNKDVILRHLNAITLGISEPGLKGKMIDYIDIQGNLKTEVIEELIRAFQNSFEETIQIALEAWDSKILEPAGLHSADAIRTLLHQQIDKIRELFERTQRQIFDLRQVINEWQIKGYGDYNAISAMELIRRLLGVIDSKNKEKDEADDRTSGYPMRRFAEFGLLPGYEFPSSPSCLRLLGDRNEEETLSVERHFGLAQYQPQAPVHARGHRWRVCGLDMSSPWNPKSSDPSWCYSICSKCGLRYGSQSSVQCPRCHYPQGTESSYPGYEFAGFLAIRDDTPVLEEEDRFSMQNRVKCHPQHQGRVVSRFELPTGWKVIIRHEESIRWINESTYPSPHELKSRYPKLHDEAKGFYLCPVCGRLLTYQEEDSSPNKRKKTSNPKIKKGNDPYGHSSQCTNVGKFLKPIALTTESKSSTLRIEVLLPLKIEKDSYERWGYSLGYSLRNGMRQLYMLDGSEIEFELEPIWEEKYQETTWKRGCLTFIDPAVGGSGFLDRAASEIHLIAKKSLEHLVHTDCESACYRCLKSYQNQRIHHLLSWPHVLPDLEILSSASPQLLEKEPKDQDDPKPWIEAYQSGVGSPLELKFLRIFEANKIDVEKQVPIAPTQDGIPISTADFVVKAKNVAIYIDGVAFHTGKNLRRDRHIRERLRNGNIQWKILEFGAKDLKNPEKIIASISGK